MIVQSKIDNNHSRSYYNESSNLKQMKTKQRFLFKIKQKKSEKMRELSLLIQYSV